MDQRQSEHHHQQQDTLKREIQLLRRDLIWVAVIIATVNTLINTAFRLWDHYHPHRPAPPPAQTTPAPQISASGNTLHLSNTPATTPPDPARDWLTTEEVANREDKDPRTILTWIDEGLIQPPPIKTGRAWRIPRHYQLTAPPAPGHSASAASAASENSR